MFDETFLIERSGLSNEIGDGLSVQVRVRTDDRRLYIGRKDKENGRTNRWYCGSVSQLLRRSPTSCSKS